MTIGDLHQLLHELDATGSEWPQGYDWAAEHARIEAFRKHLDKELPSPSIPNYECQDCSFAAYLLLPKETSVSEGQNAVYISNFGSLLTIQVEQNVDAAIRDRIQCIARTNGFTFVPYEDLQKPYRGVHSGMTWWDRFFEYT